MNIRLEIGRRLKSSREAKGLTLREVCDLVPGLTTNRLSNWEQGYRIISIEEAKRIAHVLGVSAAWLLTLSSEQPDRSEHCLLDMYRASDQRGKDTILRVAESESHYGQAEKQQDSAA